MNALNLTLIFACCEILDIYFNHKNNVSEMLDGYVQKFKQNSVLFFCYAVQLYFSYFLRILFTNRNAFYFADFLFFRCDKQDCVYKKNRK